NRAKYGPADPPSAPENSSQSPSPRAVRVAATATRSTLLPGNRTPGRLRDSSGFGPACPALVPHQCRTWTLRTEGPARGEGTVAAMGGNDPRLFHWRPAEGSAEPLRARL